LACKAWFDKLELLVGPAMQQSENYYREHIFLADLRDRTDRDQVQIWHEHQQMQLSFLKRKGFSGSTNILDLGCGPMRLGSALIPELVSGWYYGQDINSETIAYGHEVLQNCGVELNANYTLFASENFELDLVDRKIDIAFSNSLFSHLNLNSIYTCLLQLSKRLSSSAVYYSSFFIVPADSSWLEVQARSKWGNQFSTFSFQDPYHYHRSLLESVAREAGYRMDLVGDYGHPTQTMARFWRKRNFWF
jgi:SAM-dependent methyltransferase